MFLFLFCLFVSLAFGLLPLKPEGEHTLAKSVWGQQTIHFMLRDEFLTRDHAERLEVRPVFRDLRALRCPHSLNPQIFTSRSERETWGPVTFWNETRRFWGQHVTSPGLQRVGAQGRESRSAVPSSPANCAWVTSPSYPPWRSEGAATRTRPPSLKII